MKPKRYFYVLLGILSALVVGGAAGYYYADKLVQKKASDLRLSLAQVAVAGEQVDQLKQLQKQYDVLKPKFAKLEQALPRTKQQSELILQLQQLATNAGMSIPTASFTSSSNASSLPSQTSQTVKVGSIIALPLSFQLSGTYPQMQDFLQKLEQMGRYTNVTSLTITHSQSSNALTFNVTLYAFIKP